MPSVPMRYPHAVFRATTLVRRGKKWFRYDAPNKRAGKATWTMRDGDGVLLRVRSVAFEEVHRP